MRNITLINGMETETTMTRAEVLEQHRQTMAAHDEKMALLRSIHAEEPLYQGYAADADRDARDEANRKRDLGLTTEENTKTEAIGIRDTLDGCSAVLERHPHGFKLDWSPAENKEAEKWAASLVK